MARVIREVDQEARETADRQARKIISEAIQRYASDEVSEVTVSSVDLPSDELKGRIIGRGGRNIRALENAAGVDLIVDDTPEAVTISSFDPVRREVARLALTKLIMDGRIHPGRIEQVVAKSTREVEAIIQEEGERAVFDVGITGMHPELIKLLGRLKYRTSYGQNQLEHAIQTAHLAGMMAAELGADVVKTYWCEDFEKVPEGCPVPVVMAGGPKCETNREVFEFVHDGMQRGAVGINLGRNVWQSEHPVPMAKALRAIVHDHADVEEAVEIFEAARSAGQ